MNTVISVAEAGAIVRAAVPAPRAHEVALGKAHGKVLAQAVTAARDQPPFAASAMDGYAVTALTDVPLQVIGESIAGRRFRGALGQGQAVRIFTGAPVPPEAAFVVMQENVERTGDTIVIRPEGLGGGKTFIRPAGGDFTAGAVLCEAGRRLDAWTLALVAAAGVGRVKVRKGAKVVIFSNGDELARPGQSLRPDQVFESASFAVMALGEAWGGRMRLAGHAGDSEKAIVKVLEDVRADLIVALGGASVGDHDLVRPALHGLGLKLAFAGVNVRPGRPTWFGRLANGCHVLGLPGNPASAMVGAELFLRPYLAEAAGLRVPPPVTAVLTADTPGDGPREAYLRGRLARDGDGRLTVTAFREQDSSLVQLFARANALIRIPPGAEALKAGETVEVLRLDRL